MRLGIQNDELDALKDLPNATAILKRAVETVSVSSEKNKKRIKKLCKNRNKSGKGETKIVANVETSNRFAPLAHACTDNDPRSHHTKSAKPKCHTRVKRSRKAKSKRNVNDNKKTKSGENYRCIHGEGPGKACNRQNPGYLRLLLPMPWRQHDDVIKWKHFPRYWPFVRGIHRSPVNFPHKGQWRGALMFSLICVWINGWVNNRETGDLRRYRAHYNVTVMVWRGFSQPKYWKKSISSSDMCAQNPTECIRWIWTTFPGRISRGTVYISRKKEHFVLKKPLKKN